MRRSFHPASGFARSRRAATALPVALLLTLAAALPLVFGLGGCDAADAADPAVLLDDARIARQRGDLDEAVRLYEEALRADPNHGGARVELASTVLEQADVDLLDLDRIALFLSEAQATPPPAPAAPTAPTNGLGAQCAYADDPTAVPFDPRSVEGYPDLFADRVAIQAALAILQGAGPVPGGAVIPASLRFADLCSGIEDGQLVYDRGGVLAEMQARGLTNEAVESALAVNAVGRLLDAYFFLVEDVAEQTTWYRLADGSVGVCAADEEALRAQAETAIGDVGEALTSLDLRAYSLALRSQSDDAAGYVQDALDAYESIADDLGPYCTGS